MQCLLLCDALLVFERHDRVKCLGYAMMRYVTVVFVVCVFFLPSISSWTLVSARGGAWVWVLFWSWYSPGVLLLSSVMHLDLVFFD